jgi:opacity protein-like surface antigen
LKNLIFALSFIVAGSSVALAQSTPAASRLGDLQIGGTYTNAAPDYGTKRLNGYGAYSTFDFYRHIGAEIDFHQLYGIQSTSPGRLNDRNYERSYEVGGRYFWNFDRFKPYAKGMYGRGVTNFPALLPGNSYAFNMLDMGAGVDFAAMRHLNVRAEYEYQKWFSGPALPNGLSPQMITVGAAYHFPPGKPRRR